PAEPLRVRPDRKAYLRADALFGAEQREVTVGGPASDEFDRPNVLEVLPGTVDRPAPLLLELRARPAVETLPHPRQALHAEVVQRREPLLVGPGVLDLLLAVLLEALFESRIVQLLGQDRRDVDRPPWSDALGSQPVERV